MEIVPRPEGLPPKDKIGNLDQLQRFDFYLAAIDGENYPNKRKVALLVSISGKTGWDIFNSLPLSAANKKKYDAVVKAFDEHCSPRKNETCIVWEVCAKNSSAVRWWKIRFVLNRFGPKSPVMQLWRFDWFNFLWPNCVWNKKQKNKRKIAPRQWTEFGKDY